MKNQGQNDWIDITTTIQNGMVHWPGDEPVNVRLTSSIKDGAVANVTSLSMSAHTATHLDAQRHFIRDGKDITQISLDVLIGPVKVFFIRDNAVVSLKEIENLPIEKGDRILFKTRNSSIDWPLKAFQKDFVHLATAAAKYLKDKGVVCIGIDYLSIAGEENGAEVHQILLGSDIVIIEGLWLRDVEEGTYDMICLPMKIQGADGAPARVVIRKKF